jgi:hypothetical protein
MGLMLVIIAALFVIGFRYQRGKQIPSWIESLVAREN